MWSAIWNAWTKWLSCCSAGILGARAPEAVDRRRQVDSRSKSVTRIGSEGTDNARLAAEFKLKSRSVTRIGSEGTDNARLAAEFKLKSAGARKGPISFW